MTERDSLRVKTWFAEAADLPEEERAAFLDAACGGEPALRAEVESLLACDSLFEIGARDDSFLKSPLVVTAEGTQDVQQALLSLDPIDREVLHLRHFGKLGRAETAQVLRISKDDAAKLYLGALKRLNEALATLAGGGEHCHSRR